MPKTRTIDVTQVFHYSRDIEIVKRFIEQLTKHSDTIAKRPDPESDYEQLAELADYVAANLTHVRNAVSEAMADDIKTQIAEGKFPLRTQQVEFHPFTPYEANPLACDECGGQKDILTHTL
jgi:hypothetical protein